MHSKELQLSRTLKEALRNLEKYLNADVLGYFGEIQSGADDFVRSLIEELAADGDKCDSLVVVLTTPGGSINPLKRLVTLFRHFYKKVVFVVPNFAYSAGTILCMSGDEIWMNYYSVLGPIDPQVQSKDGEFVAALGYLDKVSELIEKSRNGTLTEAEFLLLREQDLAKLRTFEQAKELAIDLIEDWLAVYKFKDWEIHANGLLVTDEEKRAQARSIAATLSDNAKWKSHSRPISMTELAEMGLKIRDYYDDPNLERLIDMYYDLAAEYMKNCGFTLFCQTRRHL